MGKDSGLPVKRGCLLGGGILAVFLSGIVMILWWGFHEWGMPWVQSWQELRNPFVRKSITVTGEPRGSPDPQQFPRDIYLPGNAAGAAFRTASGEAWAVLDGIPEDVPDLVNRYRHRMMQRGWRLRETENLLEGVRLVFQKGSVRALVSLYGTGTGTRVWIVRTARR